MSATIHCRIDDELERVLDAFAEANGLTRPQAVRELLRRTLTSAPPIDRGWTEGFSAGYADAQEAIAKATGPLRG